MQFIKLYIENQLVDIDNSIQISLNKRAIDFSDQTKRPAPFTYTIKLPKTKTNRKVFKHIDYLHITNRFSKTEHYKCDLYVNGQLMITGSYILRKISDYFEGNIVGEVQGLFLDFGDKTLQDLKLPEIEYEGVMLPYDNWGTTYNNNVLVGTHSNSVRTRYAYASASNYCLNPKLAFDFQSLISGYKDPNLGLYGSSASYTDYYRTGLVAYSNFPSIKSNLSWNTITNNLSIYDFMPQIIYSKVVEQIFLDLGYQIIIQDDLITDPDLLIPYFGDDDPEFNWLQLARFWVYSDKSSLEALSYRTNALLPGDKLVFNQYEIFPILNSRWVDPDPQPPNEFDPNPPAPFRMLTSVPDRYNQFTDIVHFNKYTATSSVINTLGNIFPISNDPSDIIKYHYMLTNGIEYDFNNNFRVFDNPAAGSFAQRAGNTFFVPADGEYEFDLDITHRIRTNNYIYTQLTTGTDGESDPKDWMKSSAINGYDGISPNTWNYDGQEQFYAANMVMWIKNDEFTSITSEYEKQFSYLTPNKNKLKSARKIKNLVSDNVIAYYNPMLRDLWTGGHNMPWDQYIVAESSILVNPNPIPTGSDFDSLLYQGFGKDTTILNYVNQIGYDAVVNDPFHSGRDDNYSRTNQYKRKLVRTKKLWGDDNTNMPSGIGKSKVYENFTFPPLAPINNITFTNYANGNVKFKFKAKLNKGDNIRMVYSTTDQFRKYGTDNFNMSTGRSNGFWTYINGTTASGFNSFNFAEQVKYNDLYVDEYTINSYKVKCVSEDLYSNKLKLANFLPKIAINDFLSDFLKSNNLYYYQKDNKIYFKKLDDYFIQNNSIDLTSKIDPTTINLTPIAYKRNISFGLSTKDGYDFKDLIDNIVVDQNKTKSIYDDPTLQDITSKLFYTSINKDYILRFYTINYGAGFIQSGTIYNDNNTHNGNGATSSGLISVPSFQEGGDFHTDPNETGISYQRGNYLINYNGKTDLYYDVDIRNLTTPTNHNDLGFRDVSWLINGVPFYNISPNLAITSGGYLDNTNRVYQFTDRFSDSDNICTIDALFNLSISDYNKLDPTIPIIINNTTYYIQEIENFNPIQPSLTKIYLTKI